MTLPQRGAVETDTREGTSFVADGAVSSQLLLDLAASPKQKPGRRSVR
jgi:hypothetical protein